MTSPSKKTKKYEELTEENFIDIMKHGKLSKEGQPPKFKKTGDIVLSSIKYCALCKCNLANITYHINTDKHLTKLGKPVPHKVSMRGKIKSKRIIDDTCSHCNGTGRYYMGEGDYCDCFFCVC
jgi:hypothetical protein